MEVVGTVVLDGPLRRRTIADGREKSGGFVCGVGGPSGRTVPTGANDLGCGANLRTAEGGGSCIPCHPERSEGSQP